MKLAAFTLLCLFALAVAKPGKVQRKTSPNIVNPDPDPDSLKGQSPEYNSNYNEGDIKPSKGKKKGDAADRNAVKDKSRYWPQGVVPYQIDGTVDSDMKAKIKVAIKDYKDNTCIKFQPRNGETDYVEFTSADEGCYARLGRQGGRQEINLQNPGCHPKGTVIHEMLHTIGFAHEQARNDRDKYVTINWNNIEPDAKSQFDKLPVENENTMGYPYDLDSVMHYDTYGFSIDYGKKKAITTKDPSKQNLIGQRQGFSKQDIKEVNTLYKCSGKTSGIGGKNGCLDKAGTIQCEAFLKYSPAQNKRLCDTPSTRAAEMCAMSCKKC